MGWYGEIRTSPCCISCRRFRLVLQMSQPSRRFELRDTQYPVSGVICRCSALRFPDWHRRSATHHQSAETNGRLGRNDKKFHAHVPARHHHQTGAAQLHPGRPTSAGHDRVQVELTFGGRPIHSNINNFPERSMKDPDEIGQLVCHRPGVRPPRSVDIGAQVPGEGEPDRTGQPSRPVEAVHDGCASARGTSRSVGRSEKISASAGSTDDAPAGADSCRSRCENNSDVSMKSVLERCGTTALVWITKRL